VGEAGRAPDTPLTMAMRPRGDSGDEPSESAVPVTGTMAPPPKAANGNGDDSAADSRVSTEQGKTEGTSPGQVVRQAVAATNNWFTSRVPKASTAPGAPTTPSASAAPASSAKPAQTDSEEPAVSPVPSDSEALDTSSAESTSASPSSSKPAEPPESSAAPVTTPAPARPASSPAASNGGSPARPVGAFNAFRAATASAAARAGVVSAPSAVPPASGATGPATAPQRPAPASPWSAAKPPKKKQRRNKRQAHLTVARVEPWSVMKFSFVVSVIAFIVMFVAVAVLYGVLSSLGVFTSLQHLVTTLTSSKSSGGTNITGWFSASRILGYTGMLGSLNIVLITAMATIGSVIYNLIAKVFGGIEITLRESD
jgi:Transmembrane domain of unknown function (DUF3566)